MPKQLSWEPGTGALIPEASQNPILDLKVLGFPSYVGWGFSSLKTINRRMTPQGRGYEDIWLLTLGFKYKLEVFSNVNIVKEENGII